MGQGPSSIPQDEIAALVDLYKALGGDKWSRKTGWLQESIDPEEWHGIEVMLGHVVAIDLSGNKLEGTIPESMRVFSQLRSLDLSRNKIHGRSAA
jgi:hypothetical protein